MNTEVIIRISTTTTEGVVISESMPVPASLEELPSVIGEKPPVPSETTIDTVAEREELPTPLPLDQLETAASEENYAPTPMEQIAIGEMPEPIPWTEFAAMDVEQSIGELPEPEELDTLTTGEK
jgi:hypothetical protein